MTMKKRNRKLNFKPPDKKVDKLCEDLNEQSVPNNEIKEEESSPITNNEKFFNNFDYFVIFTAAFIYFIYLLTYFETISWQLSSIGRILLIKMLPYYDWRHLKNKQCLIEKFWGDSNPPDDFLPCDLCENIRNIDTFETLHADIIEERYIDLDVPVILTKALGTWPSDSKFLEDVRTDEDFYPSYPCKLSTNIFKDLNNAGVILENVRTFDKFFIHFQNCELNAMRVLRRYTFRPDCIPVNYAPTIYNWLIWNQNYNISRYKPIELVEKLTVFGQLFGSTYVRLIPRKNCESICPFLNIKLSAGEILIFTSMWDLEYRPNETGENMAVVMDIRH